MVVQLLGGASWLTRRSSRYAAVSRRSDNDADVPPAKREEEASPLSSGVEHVLGKDGVASSTLAEGSTNEIEN
jgi:hypothetical protein